MVVLFVIVFGLVVLVLCLSGSAQIVATVVESVSVFVVNALRAWNEQGVHVNCSTPVVLENARLCVVHLRR